MNTSINKTGLQPVSRTCGTTPFGFRIAEEKSDRHYVLKDNGAFSNAKPIFKPVTKHLEAENEYLPFGPTYFYKYVFVLMKYVVLFYNVFSYSMETYVNIFIHK